LLLGAIIGHVLLKNADHFNVLQSQSDLLINLEKSGWITILGLMLVFAAIGKSAQFPFLNWPARAMEGPTPSSAIFYGALSIHCGVFLLYRTYPIWGQSNIIVSVIIAIALVTILLASGIGRVQSNIKGQLAYASVTQISIMFIEVALGLHTLVLFHIISHCLLRCYQLLVSPSIIVEHIKTINKDDVRLSKKSFETYLPLKLKNTLYSLMFQEGLISTTERGMFLMPAIHFKLLARKISNSVLTPMLLFP
ncbi:MAG: NADH-quinone oxidoreductase subunit E, partial [Bdellovibrionaceae bacterium]|nr:NADH-quinone oxidoreductase subunit E [Pseudobdellovibrionaceae bacterium]